MEYCKRKRGLLDKDQSSTGLDQHRFHHVTAFAPRNKFPFLRVSNKFFRDAGFPLFEAWDSGF